MPNKIYKRLLFVLLALVSALGGMPSIFGMQKKSDHIIRIVLYLVDGELQNSSGKPAYKEHVWSLEKFAKRNPKAERLIRSRYAEGKKYKNKRKSNLREECVYPRSKQVIVGNFEGGDGTGWQYITEKKECCAIL